MFKDSDLRLITRLGTYHPKFWMLRILVISLVALLLIHISSLVSPEGLEIVNNRWKVYLLAIVAFNSVSEINILVMSIIRRISWFRWQIYLRALIVLILSLFLVLFWVFMAEKILGTENILNHRGAQITLIFGFLILIIHLLFIIISDLTQEWLDSRKEVSELKEAKLLSDYNSLKDRLNPHFLFNNLSVLKSLIHYNPAEAEIFTQNFTNVYRYVLNSREEKTVTLKEELKFLESYIALHKQRIGEGLHVNIRVSDEVLFKSLPPLTLQLLVENAIKHNVVNRHTPLQIDIYNENNFLNVKNNLNKKETTYSTFTGLKTLIAQYKVISGSSITITENKEFYRVRFPLL